MTKPELGRLRRIDDLRAYWDNEATDFTPWLASADNIALISEATGLDLEVVSEEKHVGPFRADILCRDRAALDDSPGWVVVENQLERTDHTHLGQLITYAAGLGARAVVWISPKITPEHRAAIDWLNTIASARIGFFALTVELWSIEGYEKAAPHFTVVCKPNDWQRAVAEAGEAAEHDNLSERNATYLAFWTSFKALCERSETPFRMQKPYGSSYTYASIGRTNFVLSPQLDPVRGIVLIGITVMRDPTGAAYKALRESAAAAESTLGIGLTWDYKEGRAQNYAYHEHPFPDQGNRDSWEAQQVWLRDAMVALHRVFRPIVRDLMIPEG